MKNQETDITVKYERRRFHANICTWINTCRSKIKMLNFNTDARQGFHNEDIYAQEYSGSMT